MRITENELVEILRGVEFPTMTSIVSNTELDLYKRNNPYFGVRKFSQKYKLLTGFDYDKSVDRRQKNEGVDQIDTDPNGHGVWFDIVSKGLVTDKKTHSKYYFRYQYQDDSTIKSDYVFNGDPIERVMFTQFEKEKKDNYQNQGLENPLKFQVCKIENIDTMSINGEHYEIIHR